MEKTSLPNKLLVIASGLMAFGTLFYGGVAIFQYRMMREQSETTKGQLGAMQEQANLIQGQLNTMRDQANSMRAQTNTLNESLAETRKAVNAAEKQAGTSQTSARAAEASAKFAGKTVDATREATLTSNRAYLTVREIHAPQLSSDKPSMIYVEWDNDGNSSARTIKGGVAVRVTHFRPSPQAVGRLSFRQLLG